jgi:predicted dehydrogenase
VGANPDRSWAALAHVPALQADPRFHIAAVATSRVETARAAATRFGAPHWFTDAHALAAHPAVDLVVVAVKVSAHAEPVRAATAAGKHVYCEWPLALDLAEAQTLAAAADGVRTVVGLQGRFAPAVVRARELVADGYVGRPTAVSLLTARAKGGDGRIPAASVYTMDRANGAGLFEVIGGHALDAVQHVAGEIVEVAADLSVQRREFTVSETGERREATSPDHLVLAGRLASGAAFSAQMLDGAPAAPHSVVEIIGTEGILRIASAPTDPRLAQIQIGELTLHGVRAGATEWEALVEAGVVGPASNVAGVYDRLANDLDAGASAAPDFRAAVRLHRLLDAIRTSAETGRRVAVQHPTSVPADAAP